MSAPAPAPERLAARIPWWILPLLIAVLLYGPPIPDAGWVLDDSIALARHDHHGDILGEWTNATYAFADGSSGHIWRPIPATLQHLAALLLGRSSPVFRGLNLLLHLFVLMSVQCLARSRGASPPAAALLASLLVLHPAIPEVVCWNSDIYDIALTLLLLIGTRVALSERLNRPLRGALLSLLLLLAALCKESALAFVPLALLLPWLLSSNKTLREKLFSTLQDAASLGIGAGVYSLLHARVAASSYSEALLSSPIQAQLAAFLAQTGRLLQVPLQAGSAHLFEPQAQAPAIAGMLTLLAFVAGSILLRRDPSRARHLGAAGLAWAILLLPAGAAIPLTGVDPLRYAYPALAITIGLLGGAIPLAPRTRSLAALCSLIILALFAARALSRVWDWRDDRELFSQELALEPGNPYALGCLARALIEDGEHAAGLEAWRQAVETIPPGARVFPKDIERFRLAQAAFLLGRPALALDQVQALRREQPDASLPNGVFCLQADSLDALGRAEEARLVEPLCRP